MCGQCLWLGQEYDRDCIDVVLKLGVLQVMRGVDSGGVYFLNTKTGKSALIKTLQTLPALYGTKKFKQAMLLKPNLVMMHARASTVGSTSLANCQPLSEGAITLLMNGTVPHLGNKEKDVSDSRDIATMLNTEGTIIEELYEDDICKGTGAAAMMWYDSEENTLNFLRNSKRPLAFQMLTNKRALFASSDKDHLELVTKKDSQYYSDVFSLEPGVHVTYDLDTFESSARSFKTDCGGFKDVLKPVATYSHPSYNGGRQVGGTTNPKPPLLTTTKGQTGTVCTKTTGSGGNRPKLGQHNYLGPRGCVYTKGRAHTFLQKGCKVCGNIAGIEEVVQYIGTTNEYVCSSCHGTLAVTRKIGINNVFIRGGLTKSKLKGQS